MGLPCPGGEGTVAGRGGGSIARPFPRREGAGCSPGVARGIKGAARWLQPGQPLGPPGPPGAPLRSPEPSPRRDGEPLLSPPSPLDGAARPAADTQAEVPPGLPPTPRLRTVREGPGSRPDLGAEGSQDPGAQTPPGLRFPNCRGRLRAPAHFPQGAEPAGRSAGPLPWAPLTTHRLFHQLSPVLLLLLWLPTSLAHHSPPLRAGPRTHTAGTPRCYSAEELPLGHAPPHLLA